MSDEVKRGMALERLVESVGTLSMWLALIDADAEWSGNPPQDDSAVVLSFMGAGASVRVHLGDIREILAAVDGVLES